ncbi:MAG: methyltransferase domain-containing protein [Rubrobacteraceae bacterium]
MSEQPVTPDLSAAKSRQQQAWASGDYAVFGSALNIISESLCEAADLRPEERVLDVATGSGNAALAAARRYCEVTGADYVPALLEKGRERAAVEGLMVEFREGDAEELPFPDSSFDAVLSAVGAMFAPDQERVAVELVRVCRPGGRICMANWVPGSYAGELGSLFGRYSPKVPGLLPPTLWGSEERLHELLGEATESIETNPRTFTFRYPSVGHYLDILREYLGPTRETFRSLEPEDQEKLTRDVEELVGRFNRSGDGTMIVPSEYLEVVAVRRRDASQ